jgi:hypothetical protein
VRVLNDAPTRPCSPQPQMDPTVRAASFAMGSTPSGPGSRVQHALGINLSQADIVFKKQGLAHMLWYVLIDFCHAIAGGDWMPYVRDADEQILPATL